MLSTGQKTRTFISYTQNDLAVAKLLYCELEKLGVDVWLDKYCIVPGKMWRREIHEALKSSSHLLYLHSIDAFESNRVWEEWDYFLNQEKPVIPIILDNTEVPYPFVSVQHITFNENQLHRTVRRILAALGISVPVPPDDPNDPNSGAKRLLREHYQEDHEENFAYVAASNGDRNGDVRSFHLFIIQLQPDSKMIDFRQSIDESMPVSIDKKALEPPPTDDTIIQLDESVRKQIEEVIDRADHDAALRPSDLKYLEFEINDTETLSEIDDPLQSDANWHEAALHINGLKSMMYSYIHYHHTFAWMRSGYPQRPGGIDKILKKFTQHHSANTTQLLSLYPDNVLAKRLSNNKTNAVFRHRIDNITLYLDNLRNINSSTTQFMMTNRGKGWIVYPDTINRDNHASTGSNRDTDSNAYTNSYDCPN